METGAVFSTNGRVLAFDGFYRVAGVPSPENGEYTPSLEVGDELAPFAFSPEQRFSGSAIPVLQRRIRGW